MVNYTLTIITFLLWTVSVAVLTWYIVSKYLPKSENASDDYFAGGNSLKWYIVAGSLMLTNLSSEQLIGLNADVFKDGALVGIWWEAGAAITMMVTASVFLPRYMELGIITTASWLGERYDRMLRSWVALIFVVYYSTVLCPVVLYAGALAIQTIFSLQDDVPLWYLTTAIGTLGAIYAISGGLKAVAVSDCLNGIGLLIVGLWVPIAAANLLPNGFGSLFDEPDKLKVLISESQIYNIKTLSRETGTPTLPWHVIPVGITLNNMYYWATNQLIVQRALAAETLAEAQKGVLFAACMKVMGFAFLCLPGLIAVLLQDEGVVQSDGELFQVTGTIDTVYPKLVNLVMPEWSRGFFLGILLGSVLSTFNSALNSAATMFALEIYKVYIKPEESNEQVVFVANVFGVLLTVVSFFIAPQIGGAGSGLFQLLQKSNTIVALPILSVFFVGIFTATPDAFAAKFGFIVGGIFIAIGQLTDWFEDLLGEIHYLHVFSICFAIAMFTIQQGTYFDPLRLFFSQELQPTPYQAKSMPKVDTTPWEHQYTVIIGLLGLLGMLLSALQFGLQGMFWVFWCFWLLCMVALAMLPTVKPIILKNPLVAELSEGPSENPLETQM